MIINGTIVNTTNYFNQTKYIVKLTQWPHFKWVVYDHKSKFIPGDNVLITSSRINRKFDLYYLGENILGNIAITTSHLNEHTNSLNKLVFEMREQLYQKIKVNFSSKISYSFIGSTVLGLKNDLPSKIKLLFQKSGLAHLIAISGLHLAILTIFINFIIIYFIRLIPKLNLITPRKKIAAIGAFIFVSCYIPLTGLGPPALRAYIMVGLSLLCILLDRNQSLFENFYISLLVILTLFPYRIFSVSMWMSFLVLYVILLQINKQRPGILHKLPLVMQLQLQIFVILLPISYAVFHLITLESIYLNLIFIPVFEFLIMPQIFTNIILSAISINFPILTYLLDHSIFSFIQAINFASNKIKLFTILDSINFNLLYVFSIASVLILIYRYFRISIYAVVISSSALYLLYHTL